jgi:chemotaxis protein histidine kinase CheA
MALDKSYRRIFQNEAHTLTVSMVESLQKIGKDPSDRDEIEKLLSSADIVVGSAKFLEDEELEERAKMIVTLFGESKDAKGKSAEIRRLIEQLRQ